MMPDNLPTPNPAAKRLSDHLLSRVVDEIQQSGPIPFSRYMSHALYSPELGYYRNDLQKFGKHGDFITAPELSPLFAQCIAKQCAQVFNDLGGGDILEFGAGRGVMAADILQSLKAHNQLPNHYYILELSGVLRAQQQVILKEKAAAYYDRVVWLERLPQTSITGVVLANEVLDAMPVSLFTWRDDLKECGVDVQDGQLVFCILEKTNPDLAAQLQQYKIPFANDYTSEINLQLSSWINSVSDCLSRGLLLLIDYGFPRQEYYHADRDQGTLMCHYKHYTHANPLIYPGIQDITAHVDFTAVAEAADVAGLSVSGFTHQAAFLMNMDLLSLVDSSLDEKTRFAQNQQILQLTSSSEMGELFKVMGLTKRYDADLSGFATMNQLARL